MKYANYLLGDTERVETAQINNIKGWHLVWIMTISLRLRFGVTKKPLSPIEF